MPSNGGHAYTRVHVIALSWFLHIARYFRYCSKVMGSIRNYVPDILEIRIDVGRALVPNVQLLNHRTHIAFPDGLNTRNDLSRQFRVTLILRNPKSIKNFPTKLIFKVACRVWASNYESHIDLHRFFLHLLLAGRVRCDFQDLPSTPPKPDMQL